MLDRRPFGQQQFFWDSAGSCCSAIDFFKVTVSQCQFAEAGGHIQKEVIVAHSKKRQHLPIRHRVRESSSWHLARGHTLPSGP